MTFALQIFSAPLEVNYWSRYGNLSMNFGLAWIIIVITCLLVNSVYAQFSAAMPRSGGDYVFLGRSMHPLLGFLPNWSFYWVVIVWNGANLVFAVSAFPMLLGTFLPPAAVAPFNSVGGQLAVCIVLWIIGFYCLLGMKDFLRTNNFMWILTFIGVIVACYYFLAAAGNFGTLFNSWSLKYVPGVPDMYHKIINDAVAAGYNPTPPPEGPALPNTLSYAATIIGSIVPYSAAVVWVAGEVKNADSARTMHAAVETTTVAKLIISGVPQWIWFLAAGGVFTGAFLTLGGNIPGLPTNSFIWTVYPAIMPPWAVILFAGTVFYTGLLVYVIGVVICSRCLFAWSFDRLMPSFFAKVNDRRKTPQNAMIFTMGISLILALLMLIPPYSNQIWTILGALFVLILIQVFVACLAGVVFPYVRKDMYEQMPLKAKIAGVPVMTIISLLAVILMVWTSTGLFSNPLYNQFSGITGTMMIATVSIYVIGVIVYFVAYAYRKRQGYDIGLAFKQIPPA
jgi:amino acid transporter